MPIAGFRKGDRVRTPSGQAAEVVSVARRAGRERVTVEYEAMQQRRVFSAASLKFIRSASS